MDPGSKLPPGHAFSGLSGSGPRDVWLTDSSGRVLHFDGAWRDLSITPSVQSVFVLGADKVWLGGEGGAVLRYRP